MHAGVGVLCCRVFHCRKENPASQLPPPSSLILGPALYCFAPAAPFVSSSSFYSAVLLFSRRVPPLFAVAGAGIGALYVLLDAVSVTITRDFFNFQTPDRR